jgi:hypothetical protein
MDRQPQTTHGKLAAEECSGTLILAIEFGTRPVIFDSSREDTRSISYTPAYCGGSPSGSPSAYATARPSFLSTSIGPYVLWLTKLTGQPNFSNKRGKSNEPESEASN